MKKIILVFIIALLMFNCNKANKSNSATPVVYCVFTNDNNTHVFRGCFESKEAMQQKVVDLRDAGYSNITNVEKNTCSECQ